MGCIINMHGIPWSKKKSCIEPTIDNLAKKKSKEYPNFKMSLVFDLLKLGEIWNAILKIFTRFVFFPQPQMFRSGKNFEQKWMFFYNWSQI